jgi:hypothetical protein
VRGPGGGAGRRRAAGGGAAAGPGVLRLPSTGAGACSAWVLPPAAVGGPGSPGDPTVEGKSAGQSRDMGCWLAARMLSCSLLTYGRPACSQVRHR